MTMDTDGDEVCNNNERPTRLPESRSCAWIESRQSSGRVVSFENLNL